MSDIHLLESTEDFKTRILKSDIFSDIDRAEISRSDLSFSNVQFGVVPEGMGIPVFMKIIYLDRSWFNRNVVVPLLPFVHKSWTGSHLADWLISARIVDVSKR